jgi:flagellar basal body-associated protein FliL
MSVRNAEEPEMNQNVFTWIIVLVLLLVLAMTAYALYMILFVPYECISYAPANLTGVVQLGH